MNNPSCNLLDEIKWISENGFDFIDLTIEPPGAYEINIKEVKDSLNKYRLEATGHTNPFLPYIFTVKSIRNACLEEFKKYVEIFSELKVALMNIHPSYYAQFMTDEDKIRENIEFMRKINNLCKNKGITLMVENFIEPFDRPEVFRRIFNEIPDLMMHLDTGHTNVGQKKNLTEEFFSLLGNKIVHLHFSDNKGKNDAHLPLGCGNINWREIIKIIKKAGYDGTITLEIFSPDRDYLLQSRDKLKKWWKEIL